jgi:hypothetical protein
MQGKETWWMYIDITLRRTLQVEHGFPVIQWEIDFFTHLQPIVPSLLKVVDHFVMSQWPMRRGVN